jgi:plasmid stabilization system protein ParE
MRRLDIALEAERDIDALLTYSHRRFGPRSADRYRRLIDQALADLIEDAGRTGVRPARPDLFIYHLRSSAARTPRSDRIARPRHIIVFRSDAAWLRVVRVLDDRMDIAGRLG